MKKVLTVCEKCGKDFFVRKYQLKIGTGKYCSRTCAARSQKAEPVDVRFWRMVNIKEANECWEFTGFRNEDGYGKMSRGNSKLDSSHRISYRLHNGEIPKGMVIMHTCDNPSCCNPKHLKLGTQRDNIQDMVQKKRLVKYSGVKASKFTKKQIDEIRMKYNGRKGDKFRLSKEYNCSPTTITNVLNNWQQQETI